MVEQWVETYGDELYSWAFYKTSSRVVAEDLVQETYLSAHKARDRYKRRIQP